MSMLGAISRSRPLLKPKREIGLAMSKWWKKKKPADAEVGGPNTRKNPIRVGC